MMTRKFLGWLLSLSLLGAAICAPTVWAFQSATNATAQMPADFPSILVQDLPKEVRDTLALIIKGGPYPYTKDGVVFANREHILPRKPRGYYHEYTVKTPRSRSRGARRMITGVSGEYYYTDDHYASFKRVRE
jgi:ribonuclease T1